MAPNRHPLKTDAERYAKPEPEWGGMELSLKIDGKVRELNRCGPAEFKGTIASSCELAATSVVLEAIRQSGFAIRSWKDKQKGKE
jgi:hypothetical protein